MAGTVPDKEDQIAANRYYAKLRALPFRSSSYERVEHLLEKLIELNPQKASLYFHVGMWKLRHVDVMGKEGMEMTRELVRTVRKSGLPRSLVTALIKSMRASYTFSCGGGAPQDDPYVSFTPTPTPSPTP